MRQAATLCKNWHDAALREYRLKSKISLGGLRGSSDVVDIVKELESNTVSAHKELFYEKGLKQSDFDRIKTYVLQCQASFIDHQYNRHSPPYRMWEAQEELKEHPEMRAYGYMLEELNSRINLFYFKRNSHVSERVSGETSHKREKPDYSSDAATAAVGMVYVGSTYDSSSSYSSSDSCDNSSSSSSSCD